LFVGYKILPLVKLGVYRRNFLFVGMLGMLFYFIFDLIVLKFTEKGTLLLIIIAAWFISRKYKKYYKLFIILLIFLSFFNLMQILRIVFSKVDKEWQKQPDNIEMAVFKKRPNIYFIQPDGYTNPVNFRDSIYNFDNTAFWSYLDKEGFKLYEN